MAFSWPCTKLNGISILPLSLPLAENAVEHAADFLMDFLQTVFVYIHLPFGAFHVFVYQFRQHSNNRCLCALCHQVCIFTELVNVAIVLWIVIPVPLHVHQMLAGTGHFFIVIT